MTNRIEDYAMIGDCRTAALVARNGAIEWLCLPRFDSPACFAKLLGEEEHGYWRIATHDQRVEIVRAYRDDSVILETDHKTAKGTARVIDFMPTGTKSPQVVRLVQGMSGVVEMRMELAIRFEYGRTVPWVTRTGWHDIRAVAGPNTLILRSDVETHGEDQRTVADFSVKEGECIAFALAWGSSHEIDPTPVDPRIALGDTERFWTGWAEKCRYDGPASRIVRRSLATLKALTHLPTGGIVAAPTTSLPEKLGGVRNWDYRFCWLRDSAFCLVALMDAGYIDEALAWRNWLGRAVAGNPEQTQILYGIGGERLIPEIELEWLPGFAKSRPVRIGNAASDQLQLDVFGEVADAMYQAKLRDLPMIEGGWEHTLTLMDHLAQIWKEPDEGIWEVRGPRQHFVHSKVMAWLAFDRTIKRGEARDRKAPFDQWRKIRDEIHAQVCDKGFDKELGSFVQAYGSKTLDASLLRIPVVGFLPAQDERVRGTLAAIERQLMADGLVLRYRTQETQDGLPPGEGAFLPCSFWYADNLLLLGRLDEAKVLFERLIGLCNDVGLLAEEYDPRAACMLGNFPQAFSHVALVNTALRLTQTLAEKSASAAKEHVPA
ncbi:MAG: glycoside hydrolase family 15 protein [Hyphomicrobiales bacterium]|nr:glycoside hydrolase family 15 protein [Hyphomicrobiales bacterium]MBV8770485.1 glycoside hydrolase family 15 protein [Hyphomicrobiales bacterium]MBV9052469.1 glycoside hydrolase family 15 protein [Hyphomicrobiales bacterium]MBV9976464.1 glycoside hydrolase family 15 protein [Hyphomicrobiales bacterium]